MNDELIERVARAIEEQETANDIRHNPGASTLGPYDEFPENWKEDYRALARAALTAQKEWLAERGQDGKAPRG
jgi:hypothetical protein